MKKSLPFLAIAGLLTGSASAIIQIDNFSTIPGGTINLAAPPAISITNNAFATTQPFGSSLVIDVTGGATSVVLANNFAASTLSISTAGAGSSAISLYYDANMDNTFAPGGPFDLTEGGLNDEIGFNYAAGSTGVWDATITIFSGVADTSTAMFTLDPTNDGASSGILLTDFVGSANTAAATGLQIDLVGNGNIVFNSIGTPISVPEPSSILFLGFSSIGLAALRRRK